MLTTRNDERYFRDSHKKKREKSPILHPLILVMPKWIFDYRDINVVFVFFDSGFINAKHEFSEFDALHLSVNSSSGVNNVAITLKNFTITNDTNLVNQGGTYAIKVILI